MALKNSTPPGLTNDQILLLGATACGTVRTGWPAKESYDPADIAEAELWLFHWSLAARLAKTKEEFIEVMTFLLYP